MQGDSAKGDKVSADNGGAPDNGVDWLAVLEVAGVWAGVVAAVVVAIWLARRRRRPALRCHPELETKEGHLRRITWRAHLSNRTPIGVRLVRGDLYWLAPTWRHPWAWATFPAHLARVRAEDRERKLVDARDNYPVDLAGYAGAQLWVICPRSHDFITGPRWRQWLAYRSLRLVLKSSTGERFTVKAPKGWEYEAPLDPQPEQAEASDSARDPGAGSQ